MSVDLGYSWSRAAANRYSIPLFDPELWNSREPMTCLTALDAAAKQGADDVFLDFEGRKFTYGEIDRQSTRMANSLIALGLAGGETVVTLLDNHEDAVIAWFAINKAGGIWVPINTAYRGEFLRHQIVNADARLAISDAAYLDRIDEICDQLPKIELVLVRGDAPPVKGLRIDALDNHRGDNDTLPDVEVKPTDLVCLIYTSGTTGPSKGCMISHNYLCNSARQRNLVVPPLPGEVTWTCLPLFHTGGINGAVLATLLARSTVAIAQRFSVSGFWNEIERSGATSALLLASMMPLLAQAPDNPAMLRCKGQLRVVTGVPLSASDRKIWEERFGVQYINSFGYGLTEATMICYLPWGEPLPPLDSMGRPADDFDVMICDGEGRAVPANTPGEIVVRPRFPGVMFDGYWRRPEATAAAWRDLWMHTGDIARMDAEGYLYFMDRKKDYVRSRGENISSYEMEVAISAHPAVAEVAYHSVFAGVGLEEEVKATVILKEEGSISEEELCQWIIDNVPYFAVPRYIEFRVALPKTPTGRIQKHKLREEGCTAATWDSRAAGILVKRR